LTRKHMAKVKNKIYKFKLILGIFVISFFVVCFNPDIVFAAGGGRIPIPDSGEALEGFYTDTRSKWEIWTHDARVKGQEALNWIRENAWNVTKAALEKAAAIAYKNALSNFLNQFAYDTATYLATGDKGQSPMFETDNIGDYLIKVADNAAGTYIETVGKESLIKFNLCEPDFAVKLKITLGLQEWHKPSAPKCTFSKMIENWEEELKDPDFLPKFQDMFNPWSNDLGIALSLQTDVLETVRKEKEYKGLGYQINKGIHYVADPISGKVKTPGAAVTKQMEQAIEEGTAGYKIYTGDAIADAIGVFINTLAGKLMDKWFKKGLVTDFSSDKSWDYDYEAQKEGGGIAGAKERFRILVEPEFGVRGDYDILAELASCPDPTKAGPTNCVITDNFRQAVINRMTVGQAMTEGYLNPNGIFGFTSDGLEPNYIEGYPYRSMIILRKFRIVPVGWEVAAQYIKDFGQQTLNLSDLVACYDSADDYDGYYASWCRGLVDPNWVLKAPLNYCRREGAGPEIISEQIIGEGSGSELALSRNSNYCADEQACIKENDDGSCRLYGYCTEERRKWDFNGTSCEPKYNTCQTFRSRDGATVSYLENTLDYSVCNIDNVGCQAYCADYDYDNERYNCAAASGNKLYFDKDVETCEQSAEGCHEFIRIKPGLGANLLTNSSFEDDLAGSIWSGDGTQVNDGYDGLKGLQLNSALNKTIVVGPDGYSVAGQAYSLSFYAKDCGLADDFKISGQPKATDLNQGSDWQYYQTTYIYPADSTGNQVSFTINSSSCVIDAIKLESGKTATAYSDYRESGLVYLKLAPDYLNCNGVNDPDECDNFVRKCGLGDVGCELYTSVIDNMSIPAKVIAQDYCPAECVGYDAYIQAETNFDSLRPAYFIPLTAQSCGAEAVGCDQFTNLDEVERGGEGIEYYTYLRQCIKPSDPLSDCSEFYTWEGSDETGFQLRVHTLQQSGGEPAVTEDDSSECNETIYNLPATDPAYNSDCREFYNRDGEISYHLYTRTITCSDNCHPYRRTENNIAQDLNAASCNAEGSDYPNVSDSQFYWDEENNVCYFCKNGGQWNNQHQACIYNAIPGQGTSCSASQVGCREYSGNTGNNMRVVLNNDFEDGTTQGWAEIGGTSITNSNESLIAGGHSLYISGGSYSAANTVGSIVQKNKSYVLSFIAKANGATQINSLKLSNGSGDEANFGSVDLSSDWQLYKVNLARLDHNVSDSESLIIEADGNFYIDDIRLTEIVDRYFVIKNSWVTPDSCNQDIYGNPYPLYMLGCEEYRDRDNRAHYLHSFDHLCQDSAVGCENMIDTQNSRDYDSQTFNAGDPSEVTVPADSFTYVVYNRNKQCNMRDKGCQRLGRPYQYGSDILYGDIYLKNNPDKYNKTLCIGEAVGCEEWATTEGTSYFKDPGDMVCQWRQSYGKATESWGWYKKKIKRCDNNGNNSIDVGSETALCLDNNDCGSGVSCILDDNDYACPVSSYKTFGIGGQGNAVKQPTLDADGYWAGLCPASQAGCTEYVDPVSRFSTNIIFNADFRQDVDMNNIADGWSANANGEQDITLEANTLYILAVEGDNIATVRITANDFYVLTNDNNLVGPVNQVSVSSAAGLRISKRFWTDSNVSNCAVVVSNTEHNNGTRVELKKAIVDYQLKQDLDKQSCNGIVDFEQGCVLFNERGQDGSNRVGLVWDADLTMKDGNGVTPETGAESERDANILLKVSPDRVCNKWLACRSYIKDERDNNVCFDIGLCDSVDDNGNCSSFVITNQVNQTYPNYINVDQISNKSGYVKVGYDNNSLKADYYPLGAMKQIGEVSRVPNGSFEWAGSNGYPIGWVWEDGNWNKNVFIVIDNPIAAQTEGIGYAPEGRNFLKLGSTYSATSEFINVEPGVSYVITAYINTMNLSIGTSTVDIKQFRTDGSQSAVEPIIDNVLKQPKGEDWSFELARFVTAPDAYRIKIVLGSEYDPTASSTGNYYFDDVKIRPALNSKSNWYTPQTCRLYPQDDALSCDYYDDSGKRQKGWLGYCLEYDRYPGSSDACLLWWPVDKVKGEGIEEGAGYIGKFPVYYCLDTESYCQAVSDSGITCSGCSGVSVQEPVFYCTEAVQTVSITGQNKYWSGRVYQGSDYIVPILGYTYNTDDAPFGSIVPPYPVNNPYEWDGKPNTEDNENVQPVPVALRSAQKQGTYVASPYNCQKIFCPSSFVCISRSDDGDSVYCTVTFPGEEQPVCVVTIICQGGGGPSYTQTSSGWEVEFYATGTGNDSGGCQDGIAQMDCTYEADNDAIDRCDSINNSDEARTLVKRLFTESYGSWEWDGDGENGRYQIASGKEWGPPNSLCNNTGLPPRPDYPNDYCAILPKIENIKVNGNTGDIEITNNQFINLTYNSIVDSQQLPLVMFAIDWGDNEKTVVTGVEMRDRHNQNNPHSLYHLYSYWDLKAKAASGQYGVDHWIDCHSVAGECRVKPSVKIKDNWGWCNNGTFINDCDQWEEFAGWIVVREK